MASSAGKGHASTPPARPLGELFMEDDLRMNAAGYTIWRDRSRPPSRLFPLGTQAPDVTLALCYADSHTGAEDEGGSEPHDRQYPGYGKR